MEKILELIETATGIKPVPLQAELKDGFQEAIVYKQWDTAAHNQHAEFRVIAKKYYRAQEISSQLILAIVDFGDYCPIQGYTSCLLNGGGELVDNNTHTYHKLMYFNLVK